MIKKNPTFFSNDFANGKIDTIMGLATLSLHMRKGGFRLNIIFQEGWCASINDKLKALLEANDLPIVTVHALRHTNASLMINSGVDIKAVSARLGHCNIRITADTYGHIFDAYQARIAQSVEDKLL